MLRPAWKVADGVGKSVVITRAAMQHHLPYLMGANHMIPLRFTSGPPTGVQAFFWTFFKSSTNRHEGLVEVLQSPPMFRDDRGFVLHLWRFLCRRSVDHDVVV